MHIDRLNTHSANSKGKTKEEIEISDQDSSEEFSRVLNSVARKGDKVSEAEQDHYLAQMLINDPLPAKVQHHVQQQTLSHLKSKEQREDKQSEKEVATENDQHKDVKTSEDRVSTQSNTENTENKAESKGAEGDKEVKADQDSQLREAPVTEVVESEDTTAEHTALSLMEDSTVSEQAAKITRQITTTQQTPVKSEQLPEVNPKMTQEQVKVVPQHSEAAQVVEHTIARDTAEMARPVNLTTEQILKNIVEKITVDPSREQSHINGDVARGLLTASIAASPLGLMNNSLTSGLLDTQGIKTVAVIAADGSQNAAISQGKQKEAAEQAESNKRNQAPLSRRDMTQTVLKVEEALKEALKSNDGRSVSLRLDPPDLGSLKVDVTLRDGSLYARIVAESPSVTSFLRDRGADLQQILRKLGLNVDQVNVFIGSGSDQGSTSEQHMKPRSSHTASPLKLVNQGTITTEHINLVKGYVNPVGLENGWVA